MRRWPPVVWPVVTVVSLLILVGASGRRDPALLILGGVLLLAVCGVSVYLATHDWGDRARPPIVWWAIVGVAAFYVLVAAAASAAGPEYAVAGLAAMIIPLTGLCLLLATMRAKTAESGDRLHDESGEAETDPYPGIGMDDSTPLGDTPEHSDAVEEPDASAVEPPWSKLRANR